jgi:hypothetical protein
MTIDLFLIETKTNNIEVTNYFNNLFLIDNNMLTITKSSLTSFGNIVNSHITNIKNKPIEEITIKANVT